MSYFCGMDIGSTTIKVVLLDEVERVVGHSVCNAGSRLHGRSIAALDALLEQLGMGRKEVAYIVSTGYGRKLLAEADEWVSEISANAAGAKKVSGSNGTIRTIINVGGQDSKVILLDEAGCVCNFAMNDKCAAGTGRFLEMTARIMDLDVSGLGEQHLKSRGAPARINNTCTVFAESEIVGLLASGQEAEKIVAGVHYSIARRIVRLAKRVGIEDCILFDGGPALNRGMVAALEDELMREVFVPETPQITTALGAALMAKRAASSEGRAQKISTLRCTARYTCLA